MENYYLELAKDLPSNRGNLATLKNVYSEIKDAQSKNYQLFRSTYLFNSKIVDHFDNGAKSPKGYIGKFYLDRLLFDIDKAKNSDQGVLQKAKIFFEQLVDDWQLDETMVQFFFSGSGYHIITKDFFGFTPSTHLPIEVEATLKKWFPNVDTTFYHSKGLIRINNTINHKTNLYKIQLTFDEFDSLSWEEIHELAKAPRTVEQTILRDRHEKLTDLIEFKKEKPVMKIGGKQNTSAIVTCVQKMYAKGEEEHTRHDRILRMASAWKRAGVTLEAVVAAMKAYAPSMSEYEVEKHVGSVFKSGYSYGCQDEIMADFCDQRCIFNKNKDFLVDVQNASSVDQKIHKFVTEDWENKAINLQKIWDLPNRFMLYPGYFVSIIGDTGMFKTALAQNIANHLDDLGPVLYCTTEFGMMLLHRRQLQIKLGKTREEVEEHFRHHNNSWGNSISYMNYLDIIPNLHEFQKLIARYQPKVVFLDTTNDIPVSGYVQGTSKEEILAKELKQLAEKNQFILFGIHHITKSAAQDKDGNQKQMTLHSAKGSSAFGQKPDVVLGLDGIRGKFVRKVTTLKARDDDAFTAVFDVDPTTFRFKKLDII